MLTMEEKTYLGLLIISSVVLAALVVLPARSFEVSLVTSPNDQKLYVPAGRPFNITCQGLGDDGQKFSSFKWFDKEGNVVPEGTPGTQAGEKNSLILTFTNPKVEESGIYKCVALYGKKTTLQKAVSITFYGNMPSFLSSVENVTAEINSFREVLCSAVGEQPITYVWYDQFENEIISNSNSSIYSINKGDGSALVIPKVSKNHEGLYTCFASNQHGSSSKIYQLAVVSSNEPVFRLYFETVTAEENSYVKMFCSAAGEQPITYEWYDQQGSIYPENRTFPIFALKGENGSSLNIPEVKIRHGEIYVCKASNSHGSASKLYKLDVVPSSDNDTSSLRNVSVTNITSTSVKFAFNFKTAVRSIQVKYVESQQNNSEYLQEFRFGDNYEIKNLIPAGFYTFRFSINGERQWSHEYKVTLLPDVPDVIIRHVEGGNVKIEWFRKISNIFRKTIDGYNLTYYSLQIESGERWIPRNCQISIQIPECSASSYTISGLSRNVYYEIQLRAHTASGYGDPYRQKIFLSPP